jgi:hypothetical protein
MTNQVNSIVNSTYVKPWIELDLAQQLVFSLLVAMMMDGKSGMSHLLSRDCQVKEA